MDAAATVIPQGAVAVRGGRILEVGKRSVLQRRYTARRVLEAEGALSFPV